MTDLIPQSETAVVHRPDGPSVIDIERLIDKGLDAKASMEVMKELMAMRKEIRAEQAEAEFDAAMRAFQSECPVIVKGKQGQNAKYAPIEFIEAAIRTYKEKHGFSHSYDTDEATEPGKVIIWCIVSHIGGHKRRSKATMPLPEKVVSKSGRDCQNASQQYKSGITYGKRTALENAYGLVIAGDDIDADFNRPKPTGPSSMRPDDPALKDLATELWRLLKPVRGAGNNWDGANQWLWEKEILDGAIPEAAPNLTPARFRQVIEAARKAIQ